MPLPAFVLPLIGAASSIGSNLISRRWKRKEEQDRRKYESKQELGRRTYDQAMWDKVNKFNHPLQQMERLKNAGLNPNLIYGSSPGSAVGNAQSIATGKQLQGQAPQYQMDNPITSAMNTKVQQAQTNNLNTAAMKNVAGANLSDSQKNRINGLLASEITMAEEGAKKAKIDTFMAELQKEAATLPNKGLIAEQMLKVETAIQSKNKIELENSVLTLKSNLAKRGIRETDPLAVRIMATILGVDLSKPISTEQAKQIADFMKNPWDKLTEILNKIK